MFFAGEESEGSVTCGGQDQTRLESEPGQQDETREYRESGFTGGGATMGPILAGFVLLPWLGFQSSFVLSAAVYAALALLTCEKQSWSFTETSWNRADCALAARSY